MAPCVESLYCAEEVSETTWDDEEEGECVSVLPAPPKLESQLAVFLDFPVEDDEAISTLLLKEKLYMPEGDYSGRHHAQELSSEARLEAVTWIQKVRASLLKDVFVGLLWGWFFLIGSVERKPLIFRG